MSDRPAVSIIEFSAPAPSYSRTARTWYSVKMILMGSMQEQTSLAPVDTFPVTLSTISEALRSVAA